MAVTTRILLIRHCEASGPEADAALTTVGYEQAEKVADSLDANPIDAIYASPYRRAEETVAPLASRLGLPVQIEERLRERGQPNPPLDNWRELVRRGFDEPNLCAPGGESAGDATARARAAISEIADRHWGRISVIASHGQLISLLLHSIFPGFGYEDWEAMRNPDLFLLEKGPNGLMLHRKQRVSLRSASP